MQLDPEARSQLNLAVRYELWRRGDIGWKLHPDQLVIDEGIESRTASREVLEIARKWGKTWYLLFRASRICLNRSKARVVYGAPTYKHLEEFILPVIDEFFDDCPPELKPRFLEKSGHLEFPSTGSWVHFFGADDKRAADRGRGPKAEEAEFDEAGFCSVLGYVVRSIFRPSLLLTHGKTILSSSPAEEPDHEFTAMAERAEARGAYAHRTAYDNPLLSNEDLETAIAEDADAEGMTLEEYKKSSSFRREYLAERVSEASLIVMGDDWTKAVATVDEKGQPKLSAVREVPRPKFFDAYTMFDMGGVDPHALWFGYWHFLLSAFVVEDELLLRSGENTAVIAEQMKAKEKALWGTDVYEGTLRGLSELERERLPLWLKLDVAKHPPEQPYLRICDNDVQMVRDLLELHGIAFLPTAKDDKRQAVNAFRVAVRGGQLIVHPRCKHTVRHLNATLWQNAQMRTYRRNAAGEHGDLLDCGVYGNRNWRKERNPFPAHYGLDLANVVLPPTANVSKEAELAKAFTRRR